MAAMLGLQIWMNINYTEVIQIRCGMRLVNLKTVNFYKVVGGWVCIPDAEVDLVASRFADTGIISIVYRLYLAYSTITDTSTKRPTVRERKTP